jgi:uncharacterized protein DUF2783
MPLNIEPAIARADDFYEALINTHRDLTLEQSQFARSEYCGRGNEGPVEIALLAQQLQELCALRSFRLGRGWELGRIHGGRSR